MNSYTITIAPNDDSGNSTTLVVDMSGGELSITDVHLHAGGGLAGEQMPTVDFGLLLQTITNPTANRQIKVAPTTPAAVPADEQPATSATPRAGRTPRPPRRVRKAAPELAATLPAKRGRGRRTYTTQTAATPKARAATARKASPAAKAAAGNDVRAYRRMPDDFATVYEQIGTAAATADHYGVPRHTVNNWIRRSRATTPAAE